MYSLNVLNHLHKGVHNTCVRIALTLDSSVYTTIRKQNGEKNISKGL